MAVNSPSLAVRSSTGVSLHNGPEKYDQVPAFIKDNNKNCKAMTFSTDGKYFAWISDKFIKIALCSTWSIVAAIEKPKVCSIQFSTLGTYLMTWMPFIVSKDNPQGCPQLQFWRSDNGEHVASLTQKRQIDWEPQWSMDEKICGVLANSNVLFYENSDFARYTHKMALGNGAKFKIAPSLDAYYIACYLPGKQGQPSVVQIIQYPKLDSGQALARRSFFQSDRVEFFWNAKGTSVLILTISDIDKTGSSYYGKQALHYLDTNGEAAIVTLPEDGTIHSVEWSPKSHEFCVIYGTMPCKATIFNIKCERIFEFNKNYRNSIYYNPHGNILLLGGFGNLRGGIELWDVDKKKLIAQADAPDTTLLEWSPDGQHFMTATTAPRLRIANNFKIWHYTGTLLYEQASNETEELWEVLWQKYPVDTFEEKPISYKAVEGIVSDQSQASKEVYRPPSQRGRTINFSLHDDDDVTKNNPSKSALKSKKKRDAKRNKKQAEGDLKLSKSTGNGEKTNTSIAVNNTSNNPHGRITDDREKIKNIRKIQSKLKQISQLREQLSAGKQLQINQLDKIKKEDELLKELEALTL